MHAIHVCVGHFIAILITACASISPEARIFYTQQMARLSTQGVSVVGDGCVIRDEVSDDDYVLLKASREVGKTVTRSASDYLTSRGVQVKAKIAPFLCGGDAAHMSRSPDKSCLVAETKDEEPKRARLPIPCADDVRGDSTLADAYRALLEKGENTEVKLDAATKVPVARPLGLNGEQLARLKNEIADPNVWIVHGVGSQVSIGKSIGTAVLTTALSLGTMSIMVGDGYGFDVALVDLDKNQIVWSNHAYGLAGDPTRASSFDANWAKMAFAPFIPEVAP